MKAKFLLVALIVLLLAACTEATVSPLPTPVPCPTCEVCEICDPCLDDDDFADMSFGVGRQSFGKLDAKTLTVVNDTNLQSDVTVGNDLSVGGDGAVTGALEVTGNLTVSTLVSQSVGFNATSDTTLVTTTVTGPFTNNGNTSITGTLDVDGATTLNSTLDVDGNISSGTGAVTVTDAVYITSTLETVGNVTAGGTLTLESVAFSGPVRFGTASSVVSGTLIAHSLATTPTAILLTPQSTGGYTTTVPYILASNATSFTVGIADSVTIATLHWMAGK